MVNLSIVRRVTLFASPTLLPLIMAGSLFLGLAVFVQTGMTQDWPVQQPQVYRPVPQYLPRADSQQKNARPQAPTGLEAPKSSSKPASPEFSNWPSPVKSYAETTNRAQPAVSNPGLYPVNTQASPNHTMVMQPVSIYRDKTPFPVDPRKPCNQCVRPSATKPICCCNLAGLKGRPYMDKDLGGCQCNKKHPAKHSGHSIYWPRPFSAKLDRCFPNQAAKRYHCPPKKRAVDVFDSLSTFKLIPYKRQDNGHCGRGADPYGCLGESRYGSYVRGVDDNLLRVPADRDFR